MKLTVLGAGALALVAGALVGGAAANAEPPTEPLRPPHCSAADLAGIALRGRRGDVGLPVHPS